MATTSTNLDTHIQDSSNVLKYEDLHDVVLCAHSYGRRNGSVDLHRQVCWPTSVLGINDILNRARRVQEPPHRARPRRLPRRCTPSA
ncbi:MAG: hypothetical protein L0I76_15315 [Pseudonocardia sp.]|nr:hypothetical protein [Pseudonocardia sp.]